MRNLTRSTEAEKRLPRDLIGLTLSVRILLCLAFISFPGASIASRFTGFQDFRTVGRGVEHFRVARGYRSENDATGPWLINLLRVDLKQVDLRITHALDEGIGLETTTSIANRYGAIAAVNAGFFRTTGTYRGEPSGVLVVAGKLISEPLEGRAAFGLVRRPDGAGIIFGHLKFSGYLITGRGRRMSVNGINRPRGADELIVYTPEFHRTTLTTPDGVEAVVRKNIVSSVRDAEGSCVIPPDGFVLSASGRAREWVLDHLRAATRIRLEAKLLPVASEMKEAFRRASFVVGGGPQLINDGKVAITFEAEKIAERFVSDRHPRTAIARLKDGRVLLATVDGRQPGVSAGMSLRELADLLLEFGASEAINLDGGGSTTMVVNGKLVNVPSDQTGERPVSDAILLLPRRLQQKPRVH